jgi:hypothetical protein
MNYFKILNSINCNDFTEKKNGLTYLAWAYAWRELKKIFPESYYTVYENKDGWNYHTDGRTCWVKTGVTVVQDDGFEIEHIEYLPVMDFRNKSIPLNGVTSFDVNKAIQRSLTKAISRHGLGIYIYAGEDIPDEADGTAEEKVREANERAAFDKEMAQMQKEMATSSEKRLFLDMCKLLDVNHETILRQVGVVDKMTKEQYGKCMLILKEIEDEKGEK